MDPVTGYWYKHMMDIARVIDKLGDEDMNKPDMVNSPSHYNKGGIECIDCIRAMLGEEGFLAYCRGNALKYQWRAGLKFNYDEDMKKSIWYTRMANGDDPRKDQQGSITINPTKDTPTPFRSHREWVESENKKLWEEEVGFQRTETSGSIDTTSDDILYVTNTQKKCRV